MLRNRWGNEKPKIVKDMNDWILQTYFYNIFTYIWAICYKSLISTKAIFGGIPFATLPFVVTSAEDYQQTSLENQSHWYMVFSPSIRIEAIFSNKEIQAGVKLAKV